MEILIFIYVLLKILFSFNSRRNLTLISDLVNLLPISNTTFFPRHSVAVAIVVLVSWLSLVVNQLQPFWLAVTQLYCLSLHWPTHVDSKSLDPRDWETTWVGRWGDWWVGQSNVSMCHASTLRQLMLVSEKNNRLVCMIHILTSWQLHSQSHCHGSQKHTLQSKWDELK